MTTLQFKFIGVSALDALKRSDQVSVFGNTSRGLFLEVSAGRIIFVSREAYRGPLTLNLIAGSDQLNRIKKGESGSQSGERISFPQTGISISWQDTDVWRPAPPPEQTAATQASIAEVIDPLDDRLLDTILAPSKTQKLNALEQRALALSRRMRASDWEGALDAAGALLGLGSGLTPEGDDFLIGVSLVIVRLGPDRQQLDLVRKIAALAQKQTTRLSASLLACAADGLADERLIEACDALAANAPHAGAAVQELLGWGATSGRMALAGITAGLLLEWPV